ncbi:hypothetical protein MAR_ORF002 [Marseillevirus marseillevirus]|uniref:Uncharacterized protein n=1 Tax=Marseillevirus marseillevirus TaxID=694581 RepID=D2XA18_GBMV|nr:hypothetical protein MAR_ORF002 [Marseillevirus marseillevirus]ADB03795.1 hypothetical protein MAR_ORF002 [Marseillevirus marseillevirus]
MFVFLRQREKLNLSFADWDVEKLLFDVVKEKAANKMRTFWKRHGRKMHVSKGIKKEAFIDDVNGEPDCPLIKCLYVSDYLRNGWANCQRTFGNVFKVGRYVDTLSLLRITGKGVWKVVVTSNGTHFPIYLKKTDKRTTFCVELPFTLPLCSVPYSEILLEVHGETAERVEMKGGQLRSSHRYDHVHDLFYGRVRIYGAQCTFRPPDRDDPENISKISE